MHSWLNEMRLFRFFTQKADTRNLGIFFERISTLHGFYYALEIFLWSKVFVITKAPKHKDSVNTLDFSDDEGEP
jgi:hypothetical protein